ncbi:MAG: phosphotransferase [Alphaproteobacteria bacterium]|nr:phosphotransferase [Alphaproteobacteria bacterium]
MAAPFRDNPDRVLPASVDPDAPDRDAQMLAVARAIVPAWAQAQALTARVVPGGITNLLFRLDAPGCPPLLLRIYGRNTEVVVDRAAENRLFALLSRVGFAPAYHGRFRNGRLEGFLEGFRALKPDEMGLPALRPAIAARLRALHALPVADPTPTLWRTLERWMATACGFTFEGDDAERYRALDLARQAATLAGLRRRFEAEVLPGATSPGALAAVRPVLAHNDLLSGNILLNEATGEVRLIDYEYGACSYAGFDLANHFCEYAGFDSDFARRFPSTQVRAAVIAAYLGPEATPDAVADFGRIVDFFVLPDHLFWGTWAVIQARHSPIDFDFLEYARLRFAGLALHLQQLG